MAWLQKKLTTVYVDRSRARVPKGTPGAIKKQIERDKWYGCWKAGKDKVMIPLATDKQASQAMLTDIIRHRERGEAGLVNPYKPHLDRDIEEHMNEYLAAMREEGRTPFYMHEKERIQTKRRCGRCGTGQSAQRLGVPQRATKLSSTPPRPSLCHGRRNGGVSAEASGSCPPCEKPGTWLRPTSTSACAGSHSLLSVAAIGRSTGRMPTTTRRRSSSTT